MSKRVVVVGAGAAGIICAWRAATLGARVVLLEKTPRIGTKILISGGGKCNITHDGPLEDLIRAFRPNEGRFIRPACYRFPNTEIVRMLTERGLRVYTRPDGRIFPVDQTAKDVVRILGAYLEEVGVDVRLSTPVSAVKQGGVAIGNQILEADRVIVCVGGSSYPNSGTTGDGWKWCRDLGHTIVKPRAALAPIYLQLARPSLAGVAVRSCILKAKSGKEFARWHGDLLLTHQGISGPTALGISRDVTERMESADVTLEVDLFPDRPFENLTAALVEYAHPRRLVATWLEEYLPASLVPELLTAATVEAATPFAKLERAARNRLVAVLKGWSLGAVRTVPLEKGEVVAGGVSLDEVDPHTLRSRLHPDLYLAGEVLDVAGPVGGYNLQAAFATGFVAGESAA